MPTSYTSVLKLALPATGELSGTWGDVVNQNITQMIEQAITGLATINTWASATHVLTVANGTTSESRCAVLECSGAPGADATVICPTATKLYILKNITSDGSAVTLKTNTGTGISVPNGKTMWMYCDGTNVVSGTDYLSTLTLGSPLAVPSGGTGLNNVTVNYVPYGSGTSALSTSANFQFDGTVMRVGSNAPLGALTNPVIASTGGTNGYIQSYIYNATNGASSSADFVAYANNSTDAHGWADMGFTSATYADAAYTVTGPNEAYLLGSALNSSFTGNLVYATDSTGSANSHQWYVGGFNQAKNAWKMQLTSSQLQLVNTLVPQGTSSSIAAILTNASEVATISATAATGTINFDITTQSVLYYTSNAAANWTVNFRASSGTSLNTALSTGQSITAAFLVTQGTTAFYNNAVTIDGTAVTPKWQGGTTPTSGNASSIDCYVYTIIKTGSAAYTVLASLSQFK